MAGFIEKVFGSDIRREAFPRDDGGWRIVVTPALGVQSKTVSLTQNQYERYLKWVVGPGTVVEHLPDLSASEREILLNGDPDGSI